MSERWDGDHYQRKFDELAASGTNVHGEVDFVMTLAPATVLDAGCGTGRVAIELARRGIDVVGVDVADDMLVTARERAPHIEWITSDLTDLALGRTFDVVVMAGNVPLFTEPARRDALAAGCARHLAPGGALVAGFSYELRGRTYSFAEYDAHCETAGLVLEARYATWDRDPFVDGDYAVSVHRRRT
jgi:2-polyprenyl-3-methyl-5-hydroxy-6-metoxy-1,4-benzoquinol methylase